MLTFSNFFNIIPFGFNELQIQISVICNTVGILYYIFFAITSVLLYILGLSQQYISSIVNVVIVWFYNSGQVAQR